jgi:uncharacterized Zn finger protein
VEAETLEALQCVDLVAVETAVGCRSFERGREYAGTRVTRLAWRDAAEETLEARVVGHAAVCDTFAYFNSDGADVNEFLKGDCSCPVGHNCKHVAAIVLAAVGGGPHQPSRKPAKRPRARTTRPTWEETLVSLPPPPSRETEGIAMAIEIALDPTAAP